jgi:23S rRNA (uracil1939-C5)-methyltransferase
LPVTGNEIVYDLYTGTGTIAQFVSKKAKKVIGVESVPDAIKDAKANAVRNNIDNCEFYVGDMKVVFNDAFIAQHHEMLSSQTHQEMECTKT